MKLKSAWWHACYRELPVGSILNDSQTEFKVVRNNWYASVMDPFVFEFEDQTYIFAEIYNIFRQKGTIGYSKWDKKKARFGSWTEIIIEPFHLSYPYIFLYKGQIYMIPESYESGKVILYKAVSFPEKWEKVRVLKDDVKYVDSSYFEDRTEKYIFTYDISNQDNKRLLLYKLDDYFRFVEKPKYITNDDTLARPGGCIFKHLDSIIRVGQDCGEEYGKAITFLALGESWRSNYSERQLLHFGIENLTLDKNISKLGIHNYSATAHFEVIDVKGRIFNPVEVISRCIHKIRKKYKRR